MTNRTKQNGATLVTALVMLVALTLLVVSGIRSSNTNLRIAGNMQMQEEAVTAAQQAIEQTISVDFTTNLVAATIAIDIDNKGATDYTAQVSIPACTSTVVLTPPELNLNDPADISCQASGVIIGGGIVKFDGPAPQPASWCSKQTWDIQSTVADDSTGANATVHQGVFIRVVNGTTC